ncbi:MAG TPA: type II secretion system F family protein [Planctomycetota bacterium]|nr:type II secretion system F family protein [Planctomycetota bacterium]
MPQFAYKAKKDDGSVVTGTLQAESERSALDSLGRMGVFPLQIESRDEDKKTGRSARAPRQVARRVKTADVALFTRQMADLLRAGIPLNRALGTLATQTTNLTLAEMLRDVEKDVASGATLHEALARFPKAFSGLYLSMVRAGETGGFLEDVLHRLAIFIEKDQELRSRISSAMAYPILLIIIGGFAVTFLMVFFIPRFSEIFKKMGDGLPMPTQIVMAVSYFLRDYWMFVFMGLVALMFAWARVKATVAGLRVIDRLRIRIPLFGDIIRKNAVSRFARTLGTLLKSGVAILSALDISKAAMGNVVLMEDIDEASAGVKQGKGLAEILRDSTYFPAMVTDMIAVGEESGNLDEVLVNVADSYDIQVERAVRVFVSLFEPALLLVMATLVGFIVIAMLLPVFTLSTMVK